MRERIQRFMQGRNGYDALARFLIWASLALLLLSLLANALRGAVVSNILWGLAILLIVWGYFRILSKNIYRRQAENVRYQGLVSRIKGFFRMLRRRWQDRREYKYFRCPACRAALRVPRRKGRLVITCKQCGRRFEGRS
ncbi:MAG: hypothetical protein Q4C13_07260 [Clostridia bacterium]|nr:hypothetical protein [Clostridia bacterium]